MRILSKVLAVPVKLIRNKIFFLIFLNGFLLAAMLYFYTEDKYESQLFKALSQQVDETSKSRLEDSIFTASLHLVHELEKSRLSVFGNKEISSLKSELIRPVTFDLMTGKGACGSYSYVLSRLLNEKGFETRFAQMKVNSVFGGHIIIEAKAAYGWVVLDPSYDLVFTKDNGHLASFADVKSNWEQYKSQVPKGYNMDYRYEDVQYSNWDKIPIVLPAVKSILNVTMGEKVADEISIRNIFLKKYHFLFNITLLIYIVISIYFVKQYIRQSREIEEFRQSLLFAKKSKTSSSASLVNPAIG